MKRRILLANSMRRVAARLNDLQALLNASADRIDPPPPPPKPTPHEEMVARWYAAGGESTLRYDYDLSPESIVFDLGAFEGEWTFGIFDRYGSRILAFEPMPRYSAALAKKVARNPRIRVFDFGLASTDRNETLYESGPSSSIFRRNEEGVEIKLRSFKDFVEAEQIQTIDLMKINIEGGEYDLLEHILDIGWVRSIRHLQIQFHDFVPNAASRREEIRNRLRLTHRERYCFDFVWEGWSRLTDDDPHDQGA